jgi:molybdopterin-dependent oxidoreductase-like protein protein/TAT (twin-arginine translocation) pathway-exported protein
VPTLRNAPIRLGAGTNLALLALLAVSFVSGWLAFELGTGTARLSLIAHATGGIAILVLLPWKSMIARRGLGRPRPGRWASVALGALVLVSIAAGLGHSTGLVLSWGPLSSMEVHVGAALFAVPLAAWHVIARRVRVRTADLSRRTFLKGSVALGVAAATYGASEIVVRAAAMPGAARRFTGSYEAASFVPAEMPVSSWMFDAIPVVDPQRWTLKTPGKEWTYPEIRAFDDRLTATLDCTGGFFSTQEWAGARIDRLISGRGGGSIRVVSRTGYDRRFPAAEASSLLLATHFGGLPLDAGHGFPARLVAPDRRGFWWVKWVVAIEVDDLPYWWQSPFPLQ